MGFAQLFDQSIVFVSSNKVAIESCSARRTTAMASEGEAAERLGLPACLPGALPARRRTSLPDWVGRLAE